jgi:sugar-specific transcriptional regulator TrmB
METMIKNAQKSVVIVTTAKGVLRKVEALKPELERLKKKGVKIRIAAPLTKELMTTVPDLQKIAEVKDAKNFNARFCIVDGKQLMFMLLNDDDVHPTYDVGVWIDTPYFASAVENMFNNNWESMPDASKVLK